MKVIFMGTPEFAVPTLKKLIIHHEVKAVFTQQPKAKGRGLHLAKSPIHQLAFEHQIPVYSPSTLRNDETINLIKKIDADIIVVIAYGFIVPKAILEAKKYGCLNIHPSDLPRHRGAAPLQRTIIEGDRKSSVCIMRMDSGLDTGDILLKEDLNLERRITLDELSNKCAHLGAELLIKTLANIDNIVPIKQSSNGITYAHKLTKAEGKINWYESAYSIDCKIRGMNPWPGAYFSYNDKIIKILRAEYFNYNHHFIPGTVINNKLEIACGSGILRVKKLQQESKKALNIEEFLRGTNILKDTILK
ncbi:methionyl-tRNA formyltransferase [Rickettsia prowazekii]|uniref:Methionyl-tRNA formyltransferase n=2 Tax=Rickettsia prowazekii TaxID=782 RepID=FMT_RICPR|nr:methionyl-tRNA formyltransferase [Rickettsia prowazekii]P50932.2 RecName: Full=Methionyl-tRNA formyltransferase [Rickettsia prowazekii str. Madrid E]ADE29721.1 Methionyl-tRNA formyltransferase [Rickettsia prowazekii str. Rp22]AFE49031.1 methionyl-tRNA formyltransferase [Rickettsia prowazekii str. Chernikova]AFE49877.1 methionyl-tRNA formyltransferase [Rickettsia prowazekii str. Katsinyian]AFE50721.1 methionyl-tRNA formyltransferase [Rickettsia prowazekii str. BuV67-CWPP]AFE51561.1 methiony